MSEPSPNSLAGRQPNQSAIPIGNDVPFFGEMTANESLVLLFLP
jgi:hypothetical protein